MIYGFFWDGGERLVEIKSSDAVAVEPEAIKKLLDEYRRNSLVLTIGAWCKYLERHGYTARIIKPDYSMEF